MLRLLFVLLLTSPAMALDVLSAGAVERGLVPVLAAFEAAGGERVALDFATAPQLRERLRDRLPDVAIVPAAHAAELHAAGRLAAPPLPVGRVGIGAAVAIGASAPRIDDLAAFMAAIREAGQVVYNRASTGLFLDGLFARLGLAETVAAKAMRYSTGAEVMRHVAASRGRTLGLAPIPEILMVPEVRYLGPLPAGAQNQTAYAAVRAVGAATEAERLLAWLARPDTRTMFVAAGIEAP